jgi:hypothetical protein
MRMHDILDLVTVGYDHLLDSSYHSSYDADRWRDGVQRIFSEETFTIASIVKAAFIFNLTGNSHVPLPPRLPLWNHPGMQTR